MPGKSKLTADAAERAALRDLSKSEQRGEADRARAILLTLEGRQRRGDRRRSRGACQHGAQLAGLLCAWRGGGAAAAPEARTAGQDRAACRGDRRGDPERRYAPRWRLDAAAPVCRDCPARRAGDLAAVALAPIAPKGFAWRRPRHTLKGRQDAAAVAASRRAPCRSENPGRGGGDRSGVPRRIRGAHASLSGALLGPARHRVAHPSPRPGEKAGDARRLRSGAPAPARAHQRHQALHRLCCPARPTRRRLRHRRTHPAPGRGSRQRADPHQQADNKGARRSAPGSPSNGCRNTPPN